MDSQFEKADPEKQDVEMEKIMSTAKEFTLLKLAYAILQFEFLDNKVREAFLYLLTVMVLPFAKKPLFQAFLDVLPGLQYASEQEVKKQTAVLRKRYSAEKGLAGFFSGFSYKYLFVLEIGYIAALGNEKTDAVFVKELEKVSDMLGIRKSERKLIASYIDYTESGQANMLPELTNTAKVRGFAKTVSPLTEFIIREYGYYSLPRINISIYATMSAGKSTLVNALFGNDYLPSRNEACTAKITSIYDNDTIDYLIGYAVKNGAKEYNSAVNNKTLEQWNNDSDVSEIVLEGDLDCLNSSDSVVFAVYDTPGTNYSGDATHQAQTIAHLQEVKPAVILCIMDATQLNTADFDTILNTLKETIPEELGTRVLFLMNKADEFDPQKEDLSKAILGMAEVLKAKGFKNPVIIPISARAARLFKMALKGITDFTARESRDISSFEQFFSENENNFNALAVGIPVSPELKDTEYGTKDTEITIRNKTYRQSALKNALMFTGIPLVEHILNLLNQQRKS